MLQRAPAALRAVLCSANPAGPAHPHHAGVRGVTGGHRRQLLRLGTSDEFYNVVVQRPPADPRGYDVFFVNVRPGRRCSWLPAAAAQHSACTQLAARAALLCVMAPPLPPPPPWPLCAPLQAAAKGNFTARLCHSCDPNCRTVPMVVGGRITIGKCFLLTVTGWRGNGHASAHARLGWPVCGGTSNTQTADALMPTPAPCSPCAPAEQACGLRGRWPAVRSSRSTGPARRVRAVCRAGAGSWGRHAWRASSPQAIRPANSLQRSLPTPHLMQTNPSSGPAVENEREFVHAVCLCGSASCRGSFLYLTKQDSSDPRQQVGGGPGWMAARRGVRVCGLGCCAWADQHGQAAHPFCSSLPHTSPASSRLLLPSHCPPGSTCSPTTPSWTAATAWCGRRERQSCLPARLRAWLSTDLPTPC